MAISTDFTTKNNVNVYIGTEVTLGIGCVTGGAWHTAPVTDYSIQDIKAPLELAPQRANTSTQPESGAIHNRTQQLWEISLTMRGTAAVINRMCLALFGDGTSPNALLGNMPAQKTYVNGVTNAVPVTILFENAAATAASIDQHYIGCMCTGMELAYAWGTDAGAMSCVATFVTGYLPVEVALVPASPTDMNGTPFNIKNLTALGQGFGGADLLVYVYSLSIQRAVQRAGWIDTTYAPSGYSVGPYEVTGNLTCKRDTGSYSVATNTSTGIALAITDGTLVISAPDVMIENLTTEIGDLDWKHVFAYRAFFNDAAMTNPIVTITTA